MDLKGDARAKRVDISQNQSRTKVVNSADLISNFSIDSPMHDFIGFVDISLRRTGRIDIMSKLTCNRAKWKEKRSR